MKNKIKPIQVTDNINKYTILYVDLDYIFYFVKKTSLKQHA